MPRSRRNTRHTRQTIASNAITRDNQNLIDIRLANIAEAEQALQDAIIVEGLAANSRVRAETDLALLLESNNNSNLGARTAAINRSRSSTALNRTQTALAIGQRQQSNVLSGLTNIHNLAIGGKSRRYRKK